MLSTRNEYLRLNRRWSVCGPGISKEHPGRLRDWGIPWTGLDGEICHPPFLIINNTEGSLNLFPPPPSKSWYIPSHMYGRCTCPRTRSRKFLRVRTFFHVHNSSIGGKLHWGPAYTLLHPDVLHKYNLMVLLSCWLMFCPVVICCRNASSFAVGPHWNSWRPVTPSPLCTPFFVTVHRLWATLIGAYRSWRSVLRPTQLSSYRHYYLPHKIALPAGRLSTLPHKQIYQVVLHQKCTKDTSWPRLGKAVRKNTLLLYSQRR